MADQRPPRPPAPDGGGPPAAGPWLPLPTWVPFATLGAAALALLVVSGFVLALWPGLSADSDTPQGLVIALTVVQDAILVGAAVYAVRAVLGRVSPEMFGLRRTPVQTALTWIALVYVGFWVASAVVLTLFGSPPDQEIVKELKDTEALDVLVGFAVLTCVVAPLAEEFFFRGFMFGVLAARMGVAGGAVVTGLVFGLIHLPGSPLVGVVVLSVLGVGLCVLYWKTGSLLPCLALHAAHNAFSFGLTKSLPALGVLALVAGSVAVVLWVGWVAGARAAPALPA
jgi:membrane protease YdiL (CAAX protease family)